MKAFFRKKITKISLLILILAGGIFYAFRPDDRYFEIAKNLDIFAAVFRDLNTYYVDSIQPEQLMGTGIEAMVESLDPYTTFYSEDNLSDLKFQTTGKYGGVGASIRPADSGYTEIADVYESSPIQKAGIKAGDIIVSLDGKNAKDMSQENISDILKGDPGTSLQIVVRNPFNNQTTENKITREEIKVNSVAYYGMAAPQVGYIRLQQFTEYCSDAVKNAFDSLKQLHPQMKGLILDLRGNPGGLLDEAVKTVNIFVDPGKIIVSTRGKVTMWNHDYATTNIADDDSIRVAVLVNRMSASASEITAGAFQDLDRGVIIGQRSFGKGLVQTTRNLPYNTKLKITTAKYYTPSGRCIQAIDYSHRNEDGSLDYIPDSLKKSFHTVDGRTVMDGGGIEPDVKVEPDYLSNITASLLNKNLIFDYATQYYYTHPSIAPMNKFSLTDSDFSNFEKFLEGKDYDYKTQSELALENFEQTAKKEKYFDAVSAEYDALKNKMTHDKTKDLLKNKTEIMRLLEENIAGRYYYQRGRVAADLPHDAEVKQAIAVLNNPLTYTHILKGEVDAPVKDGN